MAAVTSNNFVKSEGPFNFSSDLTVNPETHSDYYYEELQLLVLVDYGAGNGSNVVNCEIIKDGRMVNILIDGFANLAHPVASDIKMSFSTDGGLTYGGIPQRFKPVITKNVVGSGSVSAVQLMTSNGVLSYSPLIYQIDAGFDGFLRMFVGGANNGFQPFPIGPVGTYGSVQMEWMCPTSLNKDIPAP